MAFPHMEKGEVVSSITLTLLVKLPAELTAPPHTLYCTHAREQGCHYENGYLFFWHFYTGRKKVTHTHTHHRTRTRTRTRADFSRSAGGAASSGGHPLGSVGAHRVGSA